MARQTEINMDGWMDKLIRQKDKVDRLNVIEKIDRTDEWTDI